MKIFSKYCPDKEKNQNSAQQVVVQVKEVFVRMKNLYNS